MKSCACVAFTDGGPERWQERQLVLKMVCPLRATVGVVVVVADGGVVVVEVVVVGEAVVAVVTGTALIEKVKAIGPACA